MDYSVKNIEASKKNTYLVAAILLVALASSLLAVLTQKFFISLLPVMVLAGVIYFIFLFKSPLFGLYTSITYSFLYGILGREIGGLPYGIGLEVFFILTWISVWYNADKFDFKRLNNDFVWLTVIWFFLSVFELANPAGGSFRGWLQEIRTTALYPLMLLPLGILLIDDKKKVNSFLILIFILSFLGSLNGIKQLKIGLSAGEQAFLAENPTHMIWGNLRVFSFYSDAGQFGASQAHFTLLALILALGLKDWKKKAPLFFIAAISFYGMLISGTRGALFAMVSGIFCSILLSKNYRALIIGGALSALFIGVLKYTYIGQSNYAINRLRTALDPQDASFNLRLINQQKLADYLSTRPLGGGLGVIGHWGIEYNSDKFLSTIAPDSYWVKVWAMYGIIGMVIFFCMWLYMIGKCCGMIWNIKDATLRLKLIALVSGILGIFLCSYGNEVMNAMPSLAVIQLSFGVIYIACKNYYSKDKVEILKA